jgi:hypothetical protein
VEGLVYIPMPLWPCYAGWSCNDISNDNAFMIECFVSRFTSCPTRNLPHFASISCFSRHVRRIMPRGAFRVSLPPL